MFMTGAQSLTKVTGMIINDNEKVYIPTLESSESDSDSFKASA
jgi:hypothetical protein